MDFKDFFIESSLEGLHDSAVQAFPNTTRRQHVIDPVEVEDIVYTPYLGVNTLYVRADMRNEDRHYRSSILFKGVNYHEQDGINLINVMRDGRNYFLERLTLETEVNIRCNCPDFKWRFVHYDHLDRSLYGRNRAPYQNQGGPPANPMEMPGMCKHLMALTRDLEGVLL